MTVGRLAGTFGRYALNNGTLRLTGDEFNGALRIGQFASSAGQLSMLGGTFSSVGVVNVGMSGAGTFSQFGGNATIGTATVGRTLNIGLNAGGTGFYNLGQPITGSAANLDVYGNVNVGSNGSGEFTMNATEMNVHNGYLFIANGPTSTGNFIMNGGTLNVGVQTTVGGSAGTAGGNGVIRLNNGTINSALRVWPNGQVIINGGTLDVGSTPNDNIYNEGFITLNDGIVNMGGDITGPGLFIQNGGIVNIANETAFDGGEYNMFAGSGFVLPMPHIPEAEPLLPHEQAKLLIGKSAGSNATLNIDGGDLVVSGVLGVGNTGVSTSGTGTGYVNVSSGTLTADTILLGSTAGGTGEMTIDGTGEVTVGGGLSANSVTVSGHGSLTVLDQDPPAGEDPVLDRSIVGGYLRDGAMIVEGGTVTSPKIKLGITDGHTGTFDQTSGIVNVGILSAGNDADLNSGEGTGQITISGGTLNADTILLGSTEGGEGHMTLSGDAEVVVGGGLAYNSLSVTESANITVLDQDPPAGEDPVLDRSIVGGYLRDGAMIVEGGIVRSPKIKLGITDGHTGTFDQTAGEVSVGILSAGNDASLTDGLGTGLIDISGGTLYADTILLGSTEGGEGHMTLSGDAEVVVGGGLNYNSLTVTESASLTVLDQDPPAGEDPVLDRSIVGGYLRDGAMIVEGGSVRSPNIKLGVTDGHTGTLTMSGGTMSVGSLSLGSAEGGVGQMTLTGGEVGAGRLTVTGGSFFDMATGSTLRVNSVSTPIDEIVDYLNSGYADGDWDGDGIMSTQAQTDSSLGIGYVDDGSFVKLIVTIKGDTNLDEAVNFSDLLRVAQNYADTGAYWDDGDFNYDGLVGFADLLVVAQNYDDQLLLDVPGATLDFHQDWALARSMVPEPTTLATIAIGAIIGLRRRR